MKFVLSDVDGFLKAEGDSPKVGWGPLLYTYTVYIEKKLLVRRGNFVRVVEETLGDGRGWIRGGKVSFQRVESGGNTQLFLASPTMVDSLCFPLDTAGEVSCCQGTKVVLNIKRWKRAVAHWTGPKLTYRQMLINHEFGHRTGHPHRWCQQVGAPSSVMQQQTYGLQGCQENPWPLVEEL